MLDSDQKKEKSDANWILYMLTKLLNIGMFLIIKVEIWKELYVLKRESMESLESLKESIYLIKKN
jgi:hypothetical protein